MEFFHRRRNGVCIITIMMAILVLPATSSPPTSRFHFNVEWKRVTRLCHTKQLLTVNGKYPGPTIAVHEGDHVEVKVTNKISKNTTLHWHGIRQLRTGWADGPAYITQCPIRQGQSYTYKFTIIDQRGTLLWHAHHTWQRASVYGAFIIYPRMPYPFSSSIYAEIPIIFGEWWNGDVDLVESEMTTYGGGPTKSDAYTINGLPGSLYPCSNKDTFIQTVKPNQTYMLRIINAALNSELFFAISSHTFTVVEIDAVYTKPFTTTAIMIAPGQTTNVLITTNQLKHLSSSNTFTMAAAPYFTSKFPYTNTTSIGFLRYKHTKKIGKKINLEVPNLPKITDSKFATSFLNNLYSLASTEYPCNVPKKIDKRVISTIGMNLQDCAANEKCHGIDGKRFLASMNNQSFVRPSISILQAHYFNISRVFSNDFPERPENVFNYTGENPLLNMNAKLGTKMLVVPYGTNLEIVLQDTSVLSVENHPIHVHGYNFFIVGRGFGNFDETKDPAEYNLIDPPERNTVAVPSGGWAAIRLKADNPGAWFVHCHLEAHTSWGLAMGIIVQDGHQPSQTLLPPPQDFPSC